MKVSQTDTAVTVSCGTGPEETLLVINNYRATIMQDGNMIMLTPELFTELRRAMNLRPQLIESEPVVERIEKVRGGSIDDATPEEWDSLRNKKL